MQKKEVIAFLNVTKRSSNLSKLLLDKEVSQVRELPGTSNTQNNKLHKSPTHNTSIGVLRHVSKLSLTLSLENLLLSDIAESGIQILDFGDDVGDLVLVVAFDA